MVSYSDSTCEEGEENDQKPGDLLRPCDTGIEAETKHDIHEDGTEHHDDRNLRNGEDHLMAPVVKKDDVSLEWNAVWVICFVDHELVFKSPLREIRTHRVLHLKTIRGEKMSSPLLLQ